MKSWKAGGVHLVSSRDQNASNTILFWRPKQVVMKTKIVRSSLKLMSKIDTDYVESPLRKSLIQDTLDPSYS